MLIYSYTDDSYREYTDSREGVLDPLETIRLGKDVYLYPRNSTTVTPPSCGYKEVATWQNNAWKVEKDYRGDVWYNTKYEAIIINFIGDPHRLELFSPDDLPVCGEFESLIYDNGWKTIKDYRGFTWYTKNREPVLITSIGDPHEQGLISQEELNALPELPKPMPILNPVQIRLQFLTHNVSDTDVETAINSSKLADKQKKQLLAYWYYSLYYLHDNKMLISICTLVGITDIEKEFRIGTEL